MSSEVLNSAKHDSIPLPLSKKYLRACDEEAEAVNEPNKDSSNDISKDGSKFDIKEPNIQDANGLPPEERGRTHEFQIDKRDHQSTFKETSLRPVEKRRVTQCQIHSNPR